MKAFTSRPFRPVEHWKSALISLPEGNFLELLRSVFGNIKTPFNKQRLLEELIALLSKGEIRKTIAAYINEIDHKLITAVAILNEPGPEDLVTFFAGEFSEAELYALLINLEERLILYRFRVEKKIHLALNPVLRQLFSTLIADTRPIFPSLEKAKLAAARPADITDDRILAALLTFVLDEEDMFRGEGLIRKKTLDKGKKFFPGLDFELAIRTLIKLGLFRPEGNNIVPVREKIVDYSYLSAVERQEYWTAGVCLNLLESESGASGNVTFGGASSERNSQFAVFFRSRLKEIASLIHRFRCLLEPDRMYPEITLKRLWKILEKQNEGMVFLWGIIPDLMEKTFLLEKRGKYWCLPSSEIEGTPTKKEAQTERVIAMDAAYSLVLYPEISFADAIALGMFCSMKEIRGTLVSFELTRQSAVRGFNQGVEAAAMLKLLDRLSGGQIDVSLDWTLKDWEKRYSAVSLHQGIILKLDEEYRYLAEAGPVSHMVRKTLAPGVYLLSCEERSEVTKALHKSGVDIVAQPPDKAQGRMLGGIDTTGKDNVFLQGSKPQGLTILGFQANVYGKNHFPQLIPAMAIEPAEHPEAAKYEESNEIQEKFRQALDKMKLTKLERDELNARISRRLVLTTAQLEATSLRYEKLEAHGLDYPGKTAIAKQAIETGSMVEVSWSEADGEINRKLGLAQTLEKKEGELILVLRLADDAQSTIRVPGNTIRVPGNTIRVPLGKISLIRRIKQSIFGE